MYDNGNGPLVNTGYVSLAGMGTAVGALHGLLLTVTILFTLFVLYRIVLRGARATRR
ncbi:MULTISPECIES: hypothetical protein [Barrientosiimonas]|uniref:Uncharacterized protein n=1 Tax=Barrientosiimonas endolithica TaxID=1535208 RepID=A0ABM8HDN4_9MICO|nr:hypothetical protein [Barrientosiimonas endolithica]BDZ59073.1 hypothetical protein GCM10025872_27300 [Barrientosiimonas endolithica]